MLICPSYRGNIPSMSNLEFSLTAIVKTLCKSECNIGSCHEELHRTADFVKSGFREMGATAARNSRSFALYAPTWRRSRLTSGLTAQERCLLMLIFQDTKKYK